MTISNYCEEELLDAVFNATAFSVADIYVSLHNADPGETGANEIAGGSYIRKLASFAPAAGGTCASNGDLTWTGMPADTITHVGCWDAVAGPGDNYIWGGSATVPKTTNAGDTYQILSGNLTITLD